VTNSKLLALWRLLYSSDLVSGLDLSTSKPQAPSEATHPSCSQESSGGPSTPLLNPRVAEVLAAIRAAHTEARDSLRELKFAQYRRARALENIDRLCVEYGISARKFSRLVRGVDKGTTL
jgi:hypothetical protein